MSTAGKKKLCWNCEGNVSREASNCPYCGVYLHRDQDEEIDIEDDEEEELAPIYRSVSPENNSTAIPQAPYSAPQPATRQENEAKPSSVQAEWKNTFIPLLLLLSGSFFLLFGLTLFLFSHNGFLTLQWKESYWPFYLIAALPLLYFGWNDLQNLKEE